MILGIADLAEEGRGSQLAIELYRTVIIAKVAGVQPQASIGLRVCHYLGDFGAYAEVARLGYLLGFKGAITLHAEAVKPINLGFSVSQEEVDSARKVLEALVMAATAGKGAEALNGKMVDVRFISAMERTLARAREICDKDTRKRQ